MLAGVRSRASSGGGIGGAGALAPPTGASPVGRVPADREGSTRSVTSNVVESVRLAPVGVVFVPPDTCHLLSGTIGARSNAKPAPGTCGFVLREGVL